jgi:hypothetical protein
MIEPSDPRDRFTLQAERDFRASIRPVYRNVSEIDRRPMHIGSCLLLNIASTQRWPVLSISIFCVNYFNNSCHSPRGAVRSPSMKSGER